MKRNYLLFAALLLAGTVRADLIKNGSFEQPLDGTWDTVANAGATGYWTYSVVDTLGQPTPGHAAQVYKSLGHSASIYQDVDVSDVNLSLTFDARLRIGAGSATCWPTAAVVIHYMDAAGTELGNTKYYVHNEYNDWTTNDTAHLIDMSAAVGWQHYQLAIAQELADNLKGVNAASVKKIRIEMYAYDNGT